MESDCLRHFFDREWRIGIHVAEAGGVSLLGGFCQLDRAIELGKHSVDGVVIHRSVTHKSADDIRCASPPLETFASGSSVRTSNIEMAGTTRRKRNINVKNSTSVPTNVAQSI